MKQIDLQELEKVVIEIEQELREKAVEYDINRETAMGKKFLAGQIIGLNCALHKIKKLI